MTSSGLEVSNTEGSWGNKNIFKNDWKLSKFRENYELTDLKISMDAKHKKHKETRKAHQS